MQTLASGIPAFDRVVGGGLPKGSVTILLGETGAGHREFAHSSLLAALAHQETTLSRVAYVSTSRTLPQIARELEALTPNFKAPTDGSLAFCDLSPYYFRDTIAPTEWVGGGTVVGSYGNPDIFRAIFEFLEKGGKESLVVIDSLPDFITGNPEVFRDLVPFLRGVQRFAISHDSLVYCLLPTGVLSPVQEAALEEAADGTLVFTWFSNPHGMKRRQLWVKDFRGLTPTLTEKNLTEFTTEITPGAGFALKSLSRIG
ncbi:MAG: RAD55 family ATPase [Thermoplasmatota archaeon]